jgi:hypothetical protein
MSRKIKQLGSEMCINLQVSLKTYNTMDLNYSSPGLNLN